MVGTIDLKVIELKKKQYYKNREISTHEHEQGIKSKAYVDRLEKIGEVCYQ